LAASLLAGQVSLLVPPHPALLALPDPYEPSQNWRLAVHDMALYNGKYYLPFGPVPAVLLFAPVKWVTGNYLPDALGCAVFALGSLAATWLALRLMLNTLFPTLSPWVLYLLCASVGFCNTYPYLLRRPAVYEVAIVAGQCFLMFAALFLARAALNAGRKPLRDAVLGGVMAVLAVGSRPQLLLPGGALILMLLLSPPAFEKQRWKMLAYGLAPFIAGGLVLAWYNYARFDSVFESGYHYQLPGFNVRKVTLFQLDRIPVNLYFYLLCTPVLSSAFPFIRVILHAPFTLPSNQFGQEPITGIVWLCPLILVVPVALWLWRRKSEDLRPGLWMVVLVVSGLAVLSVDGMLSATMRYQGDASNLFFLAGSIGAAWLLLSGPEVIRRQGPRILVVLLAVASIANAAIGMTGYFDNFKKKSPAQYQALVSFFRPVSSVLTALGVSVVPDPIAAK
jgi:hypothetical protein